MQSHDRMLRILDLFSLEKPEWQFDEIQAQLGYSRSTVYRYLKTLSDAGLLTSLAGHGLTLGPRIVELDFQVMETDPLIKVAQPAMKQIVDEFGGTGLLCRGFRDKVLCVYQYSGNRQPFSGYRRGSARPLLNGAASLVILANLSSYQIGKLYKKMPAEFAAARVGETLSAVRQRLRAIRQEPWLRTSGDVTAGVTGIAAPITDRRGEAIGSFSVTLPENDVGEARLALIGARVAAHAKAISQALE